MDLMCRWLVSVMAMMCGPGWVVSMFCRSMMDVCIPRVFRVSVLRLWCVNVGCTGDDRGGNRVL